MRIAEHRQRAERHHRDFYRLAHVISRLAQRRGHRSSTWSTLREQAEDLCRAVSAQCQQDPSAMNRRRTFAAGRAQMRVLAVAAWALAHDRPPPPRIIVLATGSYLLHHASCQDGAAVFGQVTKIEVGDAIAYVREDYDVGSSFQLSSCARVGLKTHGPSRSWSVLALCAPQESWGAIARLVGAADGLERRVVRNARFTPAWAESVLRAPSGAALGRDLVAIRRFGGSR
jgi:hypothetical protein